MAGMIDFCCPKCKHRFGTSYAGAAPGPVNCPKCGSVVFSKADGDRMAALFTRITTPAEQQTRDMLRQSRIDAGLSLRQAAKILNIDCAQLSRIEAGYCELPAEVAARMNATYGIGEKEAK